MYVALVCVVQELSYQINPLNLLPKYAHSRNNDFLIAQHSLILNELYNTFDIHTRILAFVSICFYYAREYVICYIYSHYTKSDLGHKGK